MKLWPWLFQQHLMDPSKPITIPLDKSFRGNAIDLPDTDPRVQRTVEGFEPEQISISLSSTHDSVWISWITGIEIEVRGEAGVPRRSHSDAQVSKLKLLW
ncbi:hypothetical protein WN944_026616 [Citrus x changshan-huyou]|uniref:Uncharacterized protein n=1 Tax=Citrus x changshan-huyou TaxID=2935761 RepID=A0AAP0LSQ4_9ROSI